MKVSRPRILTGFHLRRGQINIERAGVVYEFQLNKEQFLSLNDKKVRVRYKDFDEIYLFDIETDDAIGCVPRKQYVYGALANQTEEDKKKYFRHKGRLNGIQNGIRQRQIDIMSRAEAIDPDAAYRMNAKLTPKNTIEEFKRNEELRKRAEEMGINVETVPFDGNMNEMITRAADELNRLEAPLLIIDEAGKLNHTMILYLHVLRDKTHHNCGIVLAGMPYFKTNMQHFADREKEGYAEFLRRINIWQSFGGLSGKEIEEICKKNGMAEADKVKELKRKRRFGDLMNEIYLL